MGSYLFAEKEKRNKNTVVVVSISSVTMDRLLLQLELSA